MEHKDGRIDTRHSSGLGDLAMYYCISIVREEFEFTLKRDFAEDSKHVVPVGSYFEVFQYLVN